MKNKMCTYTTLCIYLHMYTYISSMQNTRDNVINLKWLKDPELDTDFDLTRYKYYVYTE